MNEQPASAGEALLVALQAAAPGLLTLNTRPASKQHWRRPARAAPTAAHWAALLGVHTISPQPFTLRAYLQDRAAAGARDHDAGALEDGKMVEVYTRAEAGAGAAKRLA